MGDYWDVTVSTLQPLIAKPTLKPALLQKPPFRFLHDIVTALMGATGFPAGLFPANELEAEFVKAMDKDQKLAFLNRLIRATGIAVGREIDVNTTKIIAGAEPEKTNALLQALAEAANAGAGNNMAQIISDVDSGVAPGQSGKRAPAPTAHPVQSPPTAAASKPRASSSASSGALRATRPTIQLPPAEAGEDFVATTTRLIGSLIQKPKMTDKLLRKPPFRFLHDVLTGVLAATGYPEGYFSPEELDSASFTETNAKLAFLQKFIDLVAVTNSVDLSQVNPKKIAAGLEPEHTNTLLQQFAYAAASGIAARDVAAKQAAGGGSSAAAPQKDNRAEEEAAAAAAQAKAQQQAKAAQEAEARKQAALAASQAQQQAAAAAKPMPKLGLTGLEPDEQKQDDADAAANPAVKGKIERPKTARKAPPKLASNLIEEKKPSASAPSQEEEKKSGSLPGAATGESVTLIAEGENAIDDDVEEDETQGGHGENVDLMGGGEVLQGFDDGGSVGADGMVVQAMKEKLRGVKGAGDDGGMKIRSSATTGGMSQAQLDELRRQIQNLCQSVNPLGKCIDFVREDMDSMNKELSRWRSAFTEYSEELEIERKSTERIVEPLQQQLQEVEQQIAEQQRKIHALKGTILRNDQAIQVLLDSKTAVAQ